MKTRLPLCALLSCALCFLACPTALAHEGHEHEGHEHTPPEQHAQEQLPPAMLLPSIEGPKPWSDKPLLNDPSRFQIAIMTDRTGGHRAGVWMDAVRKLNLLRPEFVVSVGDLIEGYTEDRERVEREWTEFLGFIEQMQMRFFFVAGNHDLTNAVMHDIWRERFGPEWYSFDYQGVHFLCLCSEDQRQQHISEEQIAFVKQDLEQHADARWTLVFLHKPLWTYAERGIANNGVDPTNWKQVEQLLVGRPHTIFSGHVHHYVQYERNGENYYSLATTGGGSQLRGDDYGEFDHVTWLTMEPDGPHVVNLRLDGILPADVVTEESANSFREFLQKATVRIAPILLDDASGFIEGDLAFQLVNELDTPVTMTGHIEGLPLRGLTVGPESLEATAAAGETVDRAMRVRFAEKLPFDTLRRATFVARMEAQVDEGERPLMAEREIPIIIDRRYACPRSQEPIAVDGRLEDWPSEPYSTSKAPLVTGAAEKWQGPNDASLQLTARHDDDHVVLQVRVTDERVIAGEDRVSLRFDARNAGWRRSDPRLRRQAFHVTVPAPGSEEPSPLEADTNWNRRPTTEATAAGRLTSSGYDLEIALPVAKFDRNQGGDWKDFQMSAVLRDADETNADDACEVIWRGTPNYRYSNAGFARFSRAE